MAKKIRKHLVLVGFFLFGVVTVQSLWASDGAAYPKKAQGVLERYLLLDSQAAGLSPTTWPELAQYVTWPDAPAWSSFVVIDRYSVGKVVEGYSRAQAVVTYQVLGQLSDQFTPGPKPEIVNFHLNKVKGQWKVDSPQLPPHVSFDVMTQRLQAASVANPNVKKTNDQLIAQINAARR